MNRYEQIVIRRIVELRSEILDAIHANDINQYNNDIQMMRNMIDELLDLLVEFNSPMEELGMEVDE